MQDFIFCCTSQCYHTCILQLYDWIQEHEEKVLNIFYQFDPEEEVGSRKGKITKDNFVMCLQTISKSTGENPLKMSLLLL